MKQSGLGRAKAVADCHEALKGFEVANDKGEIIYIKIYHTNGASEDVEYHLGGLSIVFELIEAERKRLNAKAAELGLVLE